MSSEPVSAWTRSRRSRRAPAEIPAQNNAIVGKRCFLCPLPLNPLPQAEQDDLVGPVHAFSDREGEYFVHDDCKAWTGSTIFKRDPARHGQVGTDTFINDRELPRKLCSSQNCRQGFASLKCALKSCKVCFHLRCLRLEDNVLRMDGNYVFFCSRHIQYHNRAPYISLSRHFYAPPGFPHGTQLPQHIMEHLRDSTRNIITRRADETQATFMDLRNISLTEWPKDHLKVFRAMNVDAVADTDAAHFNVQIGNSLVAHPNAGRGVFAQQDFEEGDLIGSFAGAWTYVHVPLTTGIRDNYGPPELEITRETVRDYSIGVAMENPLLEAVIAARLQERNDREEQNLAGGLTNQEVQDQLIDFIAARFCSMSYINSSRYRHDDPEVNLPPAMQRTANVELVPAAEMNHKSHLLMDNAVAVWATRDIREGEELYLDYEVPGNDDPGQGMGIVEGMAMGGGGDVVNDETAGPLGMGVALGAVSGALRGRPGAGRDRGRGRGNGEVRGRGRAMGSSRGREITKGMRSTRGMGNSRGMGGTRGMGSASGMGSTRGMGNSRGMGGTRGMGSASGMGGTRGMGSTTRMGSAGGMGTTTGMGSARGMGTTTGMGSATGTGRVRAMRNSPALSGVQKTRRTKR